MEGETETEHNLMDAQMIRRAVYDLFRFNTKDFFLSGSPTGFLVSLSNRSGGGTNDLYALQVYPSRYTGGGAPPADQALRVRVRRGTIGQLMPDNIDDEFLLTDETVNLVYYDSEHIDDGSQVSVSLVLGDDSGSESGLPVNPRGTLDQAPPHSYGAIARVTTKKGRIVEIVPDGEGSRDIAVIVSKTDCGKNLLSYFTGPVVQDFTSAEFQSLIARVDALDGGGEDDEEDT